jgi:hypothetical protein
MPALYTLLSTLEAAIVAAKAGLTSSAPDSLGQPVSVLTGMGWPSQKTLQSNVRKGVQPQVSGCFDVSVVCSVLTGSDCRTGSRNS